MMIIGIQRLWHKAAFFFFFQIALDLWLSTGGNFVPQGTWGMSRDIRHCSEIVLMLTAWGWRLLLVSSGQRKWGGGGEKRI